MVTAGRKRKRPLRWNECSGLRGADGNRNHDLFDANEALYQLSYSPVDVAVLDRCGGMNAAVFVELMVIETTTSSMRTKRSTN